MEQFKLTMLLAFVLLAFSCSTEDVNNPIEEKNTVVEETIATRGGVNGTTETIFIRWNNGLPEHKKQGSRDAYLGGIISWSACDSRGNTEVWTVIPCNSCIPIVPDPSDDDENVRSSVPFGDCRSGEGNTLL